MDTIKFYTKEKPAPELFNLEHVRCGRVTLFGEDLEIWRPFHLHLMIHGGDSGEEYRNRLGRVLDGMQALMPEISMNRITGPEDAGRLLWVVRECRRRGFPFRTISISMQMLQYEWEGKALYRHLAGEQAINCIEVNVGAGERKQGELHGAGNDGADSRLPGKLGLYFQLHGGKLRLGSAFTDIRSMQALVEKYRGRVEEFIFREGETGSMAGNMLGDREDYHYLRSVTNPFYHVDVYEYRGYIVKQYGTNADARLKINSMLYVDGRLMCGDRIIV